MPFYPYSITVHTGSIARILLVDAKKFPYQLSTSIVNESMTSLYLPISTRSLLSTDNIRFVVIEDGAMYCYLVDRLDLPSFHRKFAIFLLF